ncbi:MULTISPECIES: sugar phosphate isomerase/epimerase [Burkholderiaceae]|uniref:sugar phosphate isomerase/epimerase family protein n=1 Tax=Burkholderiaceae TaxID=119060 RepID=UPI00141D7798|nr:MULTISPECIES: sugar phosphate isomerase/epimerase [Burkholderiaceae]MBN3846001.1 sugar phosphate isomerase/epimerase [Paraburkholderia sp. Ac-20342]NIF54142.1 sugar phosphate isomerase/epimerase [Burkholderia sp. Ax-1724]NIF77747.1 sugar phosphate isomerase/epimerase [Paraburkholderia sp. Cy-641]
MTEAVAQKPAFSLAHLTALSLTPPELVSVAAQAGYDEVSFRLLPATPGGPAYSLMTDAAMLKDTLARMADTGVRVFDLEIIRLGERFDARDYLHFFETGAKLGARAVLVGCDDSDPVRRAQAFAALCELSAPFGLTANIEFMPWTAVKRLRDAVALVEEAGTPSNAGVLVDALHFARSDSTLDEVRALPRKWLHYAQMCDAPGGTPSTDAELIHTARCERLLPGEGGIDLVALWNALPRDLPVSIEIPNDQRAPLLGPLGWATQALEAARRVIDARA